uniref:DDE-1 domain-containing protein n=1 Tax=Terrapene triunguis TaxID=2587831 RepID=A0A674JW09_9SAUR
MSVSTVAFVFLPPTANTTSILQPLNQDVIPCFKAMYTKLTLSWIHSTMDADPNLNVMECWKSFNIADCNTYIKQIADSFIQKAGPALGTSKASRCLGQQICRGTRIQHGS